MKINEVVGLPPGTFLPKRKLTKQDFEKVFFGDLKNSLEWDTPVEDAIFAWIENYIGDSDSPRKKNQAAIALAKLKDVMNDYPKDLIPASNFAYRGTQIDEATYKKAYEYVKNNKVRGKWITVDNNYVYKPKSRLQSWSTKLNVAASFASNKGHSVDKIEKYNSSAHIKDVGNLPFPAILKTKVNDDFILNSRLTNMISRKLHSYNEYEIIRISRKSIPCQLICHINWIKGAGRDFKWK